MRSHVVSIADRCKWTLIALVVSGALLASRPAAAQSECVNDDDCPDPACGGQVCDWNKGLTCQPANAAAEGADGWCTDDSDCKCRSMGATCNLTKFQCTFTTPPPGGTGSGGTTGAGGTGAGGTTGGGGTSGGTPPGDSGGCSVPGTSGGALTAIGLALAGLGLARRRRR